jgi:Ca2+:H+ antiporter
MTGHMKRTVSAQSEAPPPAGLLAALLAPGAVVVALDRLDLAGQVALFVLAVVALVPLAWLIGEATDQAARYTGPGVGGLLNASFGNAPELIIALIAVADGLDEVVRASLTGSIAGNLLLVLGFTLVAARPGRVDRTSTLVSVGTVAVAVLLLVPPSVAGFAGDPDRRSVALLSVPFACALLAFRLVVNRRALRRHRALAAAADPPEPAEWTLRRAIVLLATATVFTAFVTETLVGSIRAFSAQAHLSEFFVAAVIVAIAGNATEHGSAVLLAARGQLRLAVEIALASSAQVAGLLIPAVALLSWVIQPPLSLAFRPIELVGIGGAAAAAGLVLAPPKTSRARGAVLVACYVVLAVAFALAGNR